MKISKNIKISILAILSTLFSCGLYKLNDYLSREKRWFYATATDIKAFDKLYWGMSKEEVERAFNKKITPQERQNGEFDKILDIVSRETAKKYFKYTKIIKDIETITIQNYDFDFYGEGIDKLELYFYKNQLYRVGIQGKLFSYYKNYKEIQQFDSALVDDLNLKYGKPQNVLEKNSNNWIRYLRWEHNKNTSVYFIINKPEIVENDNGESSYEFSFYISLKFLQIDKEIDEDVKNYKPNSF